MALWDKITSRGNVEDRRSMASAIGGIGLTGVALLLLFNVLTGADPADILSQLQQIPFENTLQQNNPAFEGNDSYEVFSSTVLGSNNDYWGQQAKTFNRLYSAPKLVLFRTATQSACGTATSQVGPHYCPLDSTIYLDETFFEELTTRFGAQGGDVAEAYVIAHEVGHHVQNEFNTMDEVDKLRELNPERSNELSVNMELQADCFAGLWANSIKGIGVFEAGEIREAMDAAAAVGDDRIQESVTGYTNPESWTHGSSEQRASWFDKGYETGDFTKCNTFN